MLDHAFLPFWAFFVRLFAPRYNARIQFLLAQVRSRVSAARFDRPYHRPSHTTFFKAHDPAAMTFAGCPVPRHS